MFGQSGTGKTRFAGTFPGRTRWLLCSGGNKPGELRSIRTPENMKRITPVVIESTDQMAGEIKAAAGYDNVVLDHASGLADLTLKEILGLAELPAQKRWGLAEQRQYGEQALRLKETFRAILNLPGNVIIIAQERTFGGKDDGQDPDLIKPTVGPALSPSVAGWIMPACDYVVNTFKRPQIKVVKRTVGTTVKEQEERTGKIEFCLRCGPHEVYHTKFRITGDRDLPDAIADPTYEKFLAVINGETVK